MSLLNNKDVNATFFEFPCNKTDSKLFKSTSITTYPQILKNFLDKNSFDEIYAISLGALCFSLILKDCESLKDVSKMVFIGPAFFYRFGASLLRYIPGLFFIPSFNRKKFRIHNGCYVWMYQDILRLQEQVDFNFLKLDKRLSIILDKNDELVYLDNIYDLEIYYINSARRPRHLYLDYIEDLYTN